MDWWLQLSILAPALVVWQFPHWLPRLFARRTFYLVFAVVITFSVQIVGVYLVFASLVIPALAVMGKAQEQPALLPAFGLGVLGYAAGIAVSAWLDLPTGASIVWFLALAGLGYRLAKK
ncbi:hypothetical protein HMY34_03260 [Thiothrix subterranea]|nr:hypothetical protein HMY34_03260 [Thiothrix subterranea]